MNTLCVDARMMFASGIGTYLRNILSHFRNDNDFSITLIVEEKDSIKIRSLFDYPQILCRASIYSIQEQLFLPFLIPKVDLFWTPHYNIPLFPIRSKRLFVTIHDVCHLVFKEHLSLTQKLYASYVLRKAVQAADTVCTVSEFSQREIIKHTGLSKDKIFYVHEGVDSAYFTSCSDLNTETLREKYGLSYPYILYVGNDKPHKNVERLLSAYAQLENEMKGIDLILVGSWKKDRQLISGVRILHHVPDDDLRLLYRAAKVFVFPSLYEGFGLPPLEAMSSGCPVVASHTASLPEVCGSAAYYIDPLNADSIKNGIKAVLTSESLRQDLIVKGQERAKAFSWKKTAESMKKRILQEIAL